MKRIGVLVAGCLFLAAVASAEEDFGGYAWESAPGPRWLPSPEELEAPLDSVIAYADLRNPPTASPPRAKTSPKLGVDFVYRVYPYENFRSTFWFKPEKGNRMHVIRRFTKRITISKDAMKSAGYDTRRDSRRDNPIACSRDFNIPTSFCWGDFLYYKRKLVGYSDWDGFEGSDPIRTPSDIVLEGENGLETFENVILIGKKELPSRRRALAEAEALPNATLSEAAVKIERVRELASRVSELEKEIAEAEAYRAALLEVILKTK